MEKIGSILLVPFNQPMFESGLLECDGSSLLISEYSDLYTEIGNIYGGNETNFNVPLYESGDGFKFGIVFVLSSKETEDAEDSEPAESTLDQQLSNRIIWGTNVVKQFRIYTMGISDEQGLQLLGNLMDVKMTLDLGMLSAAAYLLQNKPADDMLDVQFDENYTVREKFINMIMNEGPTT